MIYQRIINIQKFLEKFPNILHKNILFFFRLLKYELNFLIKNFFNIK